MQNFNAYKSILIGNGTMGRRHKSQLEAMGVQFVGVADTSAEAESLLASFGGVDFAVVASPASTHYGYVKSLLLKKIPVLVEKPLATSGEQARELVQLSIGRIGHIGQNIPLFVGHSERYNPVVKNFCKTKGAFLAENSLPLHFNFTRTHGFSERCRDVSVVFDLMVHDFDLLYYFMNSSSWGGNNECNCENESPLRLQSYKVAQYHEDRLEVFFNFDKASANFVADRNCPKDCRQIEIFKADGLCGSLDLASYRSVNPAYAIQKEHAAFLNCLKEYRQSGENRGWICNLKGALFAVEMASLLTR